MKETTRKNLENAGGLIAAGACIALGALAVKGVCKGVAHVVGSIGDKRAAKKAAAKAKPEANLTGNNTIPTEVKQESGSSAAKEP